MSGLVHAARGRGAALGPWVRKELRDLAPLALGVALVAAGLAFVWARLLRRHVDLPPEALPALLAAGALVCLLPLLAEAFSMDHRHGTARALQGWPVGATRTSTAKALALAVYALVYAAWLAGVVAAIGPPPALDAELAAGNGVGHPLLVGLALRAVGTAGAVVVIAAVVTRHGLASVLAGLGALVLHAAPLARQRSGAFEAAPSFFEARALALTFDVAPAAAIGWTLLLFAVAVPALALRGKRSRSVLHRAAAASAVMIPLVGLWWSLPLRGAQYAATLPVGADGAQVGEVLVSPTDNRVVFTLRHPRSSGLADWTWWLMDLDTSAEPVRLSTLPVAERTGLGTHHTVEPVAWSSDGRTLQIRSSLRADEDAIATCWSLEPSSMTLCKSDWHAYSIAIGDTLVRRRTEGWTSEAPSEVWSLKDGPESIVVPAAQRLGAPLGARGVGYFADVEGMVQRADVLRGVQRPLGLRAQPTSRYSNVPSPDGRCIVHSDKDAGPRHRVLVDVESGARITFEAGSFWFGGDQTVIVPTNIEATTEEPRSLGSHWAREARTRHWRVITLQGERELDFGFEVSVNWIGVLPDGRFVARSADSRRLTLHDVDGALLRTLREEVGR